MEKLIVIYIMFAIVIAISSCSYKNPVDENNRRLDEIVEENKRKNEEIGKEPALTALTQGGQPGLITVAGVIVSSDNVLDSRISLSVQSGVGKDGTTPAVAEQNKPAIKQEVNSKIVLNFEKDKSLISLGCNEEQVTSYAKAGNLSVKQMTAALSPEVLSISAHTIVLCDSLNNLPPYLLISFSSEHLIMQDVDYTLVGNFGSLDFYTNNLTLIGENKIKTQGPAAASTLFSAFNLSLSVFKGFSAQGEAKLQLTSIGCNYAAEESKQ